MLPHPTTSYVSVLRRAALCCTVLRCAALCCIVLRCTALSWVTLRCATLHYQYNFACLHVYNGREDNSEQLVGVERTSSGAKVGLTIIATSETLFDTV